MADEPSRDEREAILARTWARMKSEATVGLHPHHYGVLRLRVDNPDLPIDALVAEFEERHGSPITPERFRKYLQRARARFLEAFVEEGGDPSSSMMRVDGKFVRIRPERPDDTSAIFGIDASSFPTDDEARLVDRLRESGRLAMSMVAEAGRRIIGHVGFSPVKTDTGIIGIGLAPISVAPPYRRRGIGQSLIREGLKACWLAGFGWAVVLGEPAYYGRFGFRPAAEFGLIDEYGGGPAFQAIELIPGTLPIGAGLVRYDEAFDEL